VTTFKKPTALRDILNSLIEYNYHEGNTIMIADDDNGSSKEVYQEFRKRCKLVYATGPNGGISVNKNRIIKYFLAKPHLDELVLLDDDLVFSRKGLLEHCREACKEIKLPFISGLWTDFESKDDLSKMQQSGLHWSEQFPVIAETKLTTWHGGKHGCMLYFQREAIEKVGYYNIFPMGYGFEHSIYFSRLLRTYAMAPECYPILKYSHLYFHGNNIPNNYEVNVDKVFEINGPVHQKLLNDVYNGYGLYSKDSGLKKKKEQVLD